MGVKLNKFVLSITLLFCVNYLWAVQPLANSKYFFKEEAILTQAKEAFSSSAFAQAKYLFEEYLALHTYSEATKKALYGLAVCNFYLEDISKAKESFKQLELYYPNSNETIYSKFYLALIAFNFKEYDVAITYINKFLEEKEFSSATNNDDYLFQGNIDETLLFVRVFSLYKLNQMEESFFLLKTEMKKLSSVNSLSLYRFAKEIFYHFKDWESLKSFLLLCDTSEWSSLNQLEYETSWALSVLNLEGIKVALPLFEKIEQALPIIENEQQRDLFVWLLDALWSQTNMTLKDRIAKKIIEFDPHNCVAWFYLVCEKQYQLYTTKKGELTVAAYLPQLLIEQIMDALPVDPIAYGDYILVGLAYEALLQKQENLLFSYCKKIRSLYPSSKFYLHSLYFEALWLSTTNLKSQAFLLLREDGKYRQAQGEYPSGENDNDLLFELIFLEGMLAFFSGDYFLANDRFSLLIKNNEKQGDLRNLHLYYQVSLFFCDKIVKENRDETFYTKSELLFLNLLEAISYYKVSDHLKVIDCFYRYPISVYQERGLSQLYYHLFYYANYSLYQQKRWSEIVALSKQILNWDEEFLKKHAIGFIKKELLELSAWAALWDNSFGVAREYFTLCENSLMSSFLYQKQGEVNRFKESLIRLSNNENLYGDLILFELAANEFRLNNLEEAYSYLQKLLVGYPSTKYANEVKLFLFHHQQFLQSSSFFENPSAFISEAKNDFSSSEYQKELDYYQILYGNIKKDVLVHFLKEHPDFSKYSLVLMRLIECCLELKDWEEASYYLRELQNRFPIEALDFEATQKLQFIFLLLQGNDLKERELLESVQKNSLNRRRGREAALTLANLFINVKYINDEQHDCIKWLLQIVADATKYRADGAKAHALLGDFYKAKKEFEKSYYHYCEAYNSLPNGEKSAYYLFSAFMSANLGAILPSALDAIGILQKKTDGAFWLEKIYAHKFWNILVASLWAQEDSLRPTFPRGALQELWKPFIDDEFTIQDKEGFGSSVFVRRVALQNKMVEDLSVVNQSVKPTKAINNFDITVGIGSLASFNAHLLWEFFSDDGLHSYIDFSHSNSHFWHYLKASQRGQGREEQFKFGIDWFDEKNQLNLAVEYRENQIWLQNKIENLDSLSWRWLLFDINYIHAINNRLSLELTFNAHNFMKSDNYASNTVAKSLLTPKISFNYFGDFYKLGFNIGYEGRFKNDFTSNHLAVFLTDFNIDVKKGLSIFGNFGILYDSDLDSSGYRYNLKGVQLPVSLGLLGMPVSWFSFSFSGGYRNSNNRELFVSALKNESPFFDFVDISSWGGWYFDSAITFFVKESLSFQMGICYDKRGNAIFYEPAYFENPTGLIKTKTDTKEQLYYRTLLDYRYKDLLALSLEYQGQLLAKEFFLQPKHLLSASIDYLVPTKTFGGSFDFQLKGYHQFQIPVVDVSFFFEVKKGYRIWLKGLDLLAPIYKTGRELPIHFIGEGLHVALLAQILL